MSNLSSFKFTIYVVCLATFSFNYAEIIIPSLSSFHRTNSKIVCMSPTSHLNAAPVDIDCSDDSRIKIVTAISGLQSRSLCPQLVINENIELSHSCNEIAHTTKVFQEKCNGKNNCTIDMSESIPHNCPNDVYSYLNITYQCITNRLPYIPFARLRSESAQHLKKLQKISSKARLNRMRQRAKEYKQAFENNAGAAGQSAKFNNQNNNIKPGQANL